MKTREVNASDARDDWSELLNEVRFEGAHIKLIRHGKPVAALVSPDELDLLERLEDAEDAAAVRESRANPREREESVSWEQLKAELGL